MHALIDFAASASGGAPLRVAFGEPVQTLVANRPEDVAGVLQRAERHARAGRWCVGYLRYEAPAAMKAA